MKRCNFTYAPGLILCLGWLISTPLFAQSFTASVQGAVTDASGALVPRAPITLLNEATNIKETKESDERGRYLFALVTPGRYTLTVEVPGFKTFVRSGIQLQVAQAASVDVRLSPGDLSTRIEVTGEVPRLDAVSATLGRVVDNKSVLDMPLNTRDPLYLISLTPGVVGSPGSGGVNFVSSGTRNSNSDVLLDGVTLTTRQYNDGASEIKFHPTVEVVQEFKVETNSFGAEFGNTGGTVINMVTKSGTNDLHGSLFEFHRNSAFNSNGWFSNKAGRAMVPFRRNQFGGSVGGPVWIPRVYKGKDRTFFFFGHEGNKQSQQTTSTATVPTALEKQGDFTQTFDASGRLMSIFDPFNVRQDPATGSWIRAPLAGNVVPQSRFDPVARNVVKFYPEPNQPGNAFTRLNNSFLAGASVSNGYQYTIKIDHQLTRAQRLSARFSRVTQLSTSPNLWENPMGRTGSENHNTGFSPSLDYVNVISPTTVLNLRWGVSRLGVFNDTAAKGVSDQALGFAKPTGAGVPPVFQAIGYTAIGPNYWSIMRLGEDVNNLVGSVTKIKGIHQLKFGADLRYLRTNHAQPGVPFAEFYFDAMTTMSDPRRTNTLQGNALAAMLLGWGVAGGGYGSGGAYYHGLRIEPGAAFAYQNHALYAEDKIRLSSRLTAILGLRWELDVPRTERYDRVAWVDPNAKTGITAPGFPDLRGGLVFGDSKHRYPYDFQWKNFAPRVSLAYQFAQKMVVRAGFGVYYGQARDGPSSGLPLGFASLTPRMASLDGGITQHATLADPFPDGINYPQGSKLGLLTNLGASLSGPIRDWATKPYYMQGSLSIQRELPANSVAEIAYSANRGVHLYFDQMSSVNNLPTQYFALGDSLKDLVPNPFYGVITDKTSSMSQPTVARRQLLLPYPHFTGVGGDPPKPIADSIYHALQLKFTKRLTHGVSVSTHYTFSKMIDDNSLTGGNLSSWGGQTSIQSYWDLRLERSVSVFDVSHRWVADFTYELPFGRGKALGHYWNRVVDGFLGSWHVNGILTFQKGFPLVTALYGGILAAGTQRPNLLSDPSLPGSVESRLNMYLNQNAFSRPAPYVIGNAPRVLSSVRAPGLQNGDLSIFKNFALTGDGKRYAQLRLEAFNATNTPIFGSPNMSVGSTSFGVISSQANSSRELQIGAKIYF